MWYVAKLVEMSLTLWHSVQILSEPFNPWVFFSIIVLGIFLLTYLIGGVGIIFYIWITKVVYLICMWNISILSINMYLKLIAVKYCCHGNFLYESVFCITWEYWNILKNTIVYMKITEQIHWILSCA